MRHPLYLIYGVLLLAWLGFASYKRIPWASRENQSSQGCSQDDTR